MAKTDSVSSKAPRGAKPVMQAFMAKLDGIPDATRSAVARCSHSYGHSRAEVAAGKG